MALALTGVMDGALVRAASFISDFAVVLYVVAGLLVAMWVLSFLKGFFGGA